MTVTTIIDIRELLLETPTFGPSQFEQIIEAVSQNQTSEVRRHFAELEGRISEGDSTGRILLAAGVTAYLLGNHGAAVQYLSQLQDDPLAEYYWAQTSMALERFAEAADLFQKAGQHGYDPVLCTLCRAGAIRLTGDLDTAEKLLRETARQGATRAEYSYQMGCILADRGNEVGAIEYFERAADMDPHHTKALFRLAGENALLGNDQEAIKLYERSLSKPPLFRGALINLGLLYEDSENYAAAAFCFQRVLDVYPNDLRAQLYLKDIEASSNMYYDEDADRRQRELDQVLKIPLSDFELTARSRNCLEKANIFTIGDLTRTTEQELLGGKNFGETSLHEIHEILDARGLKIGQNVLPQVRPAGPSWIAEDLSPQERTLLEKPVTELGLSVRARKCLARLNIVTIGELVSRSADQLMSVRNFGVTSLNEIRAQLGEFGIKLRND